MTAIHTGGRKHHGMPLYEGQNQSLPQARQSANFMHPSLVIDPWHNQEVKVG